MTSFLLYQLLVLYYFNFSSFASMFFSFLYTSFFLVILVEVLEILSKIVLCVPMFIADYKQQSFLGTDFVT